MTTAPETTTRPILFNGPMVRSLLNGTKTSTRRPVVVKTSDTAIGRNMLADLSRAWVDPGFPSDENGNGLPLERLGRDAVDPAPPEYYRYHYLHVPFAHPEDGWEADPGDDMQGRVYCPLGAPGDLLWVKETWWSDRRESGVVVYDATPEWGKYRSNGEVVRAKYVDETLVAPEDALRQMLPKFWSKKPSIHMERWASRITLEITSVRVERLQDISVEDAKKEGLSQITKDNGRTWKWGIPDRDGLPGTDNTGWPWPDWDVDVRKAFARLWDSVYGKQEGYSWRDSPWVWVVSFRRLETPA